MICSYFAFVLRSSPYRHVMQKNVLVLFPWRCSLYDMNILPNGRGARSNKSGRYEALSTEAMDDGWSKDDIAPPTLRTTLTADNARTIITRNDSPDIGFDRSINTYRGCEHG